MQTCHYFECDNPTDLECYECYKPLCLTCSRLSVCKACIAKNSRESLKRNKLSLKKRKRIEQAG